MIKLIVSDLDGTLLDGPDSIHPDNVAAIQEAGRRGVRFAVASGRGYVSCSELMLAHGLDDAYIIGSNGTEVLDKPFGSMIATHYIDSAVAREVAAISAAHGIPVCLYARNAIIYENESIVHEIDSRLQGSLESLREGREFCILVGPEAMDIGLEYPMKLLGIVKKGQEDKLATAREALRTLPGIDITSSWWNNYEIMPKGINKGSALQDLAESLGIKREEILAFGDNENDLEMLAYAGHGIAMENATPVVKAKITKSTGHCKEGGVASAIRHYILDK